MLDGFMKKNGFKAEIRMAAEDKKGKRHHLP